MADTANHIIRKITPDGMVTTVAGSAGSPPGTVDGTGDVVRLSAQGLAVDESDNLYIAGDYRVRKGTLARVPVSATVQPLAAAAPPLSASGPHTNLDSVLAALEWTDHNLRMTTATVTAHGGFVEKAARRSLRSALAAANAAIEFLRANPSAGAESARASPVADAALARLNSEVPDNGSWDPRMADAISSLKSALNELRNAPGGELGGAREKMIAGIAKTVDDVIAGIKSADKARAVP